MEHASLLAAAMGAAVRAGRAIMAVYDTDFTVTQKADNSPLTVADQRAHHLIAGELAPLGIPLLSEEGKTLPYTERKSWHTLWIVDPLDGTKEFIKKNDEFTVNIALVTDQVPVLGVIYVPVKQQLYFAETGMGAWRVDDRRMIERIETAAPAADTFLEEAKAAGRRLPLTLPPPSPYVIVGSRSHPTPELDAFVAAQKERFDAVEFVSAGSSLKFCLVAEGSAAIYPRLGPTMEWDTAAGHAIAVSSGARVYRHDNAAPLLYNRQDLLNPWFVVER